VPDAVLENVWKSIISTVGNIAYRTFRKLGGFVGIFESTEQTSPYNASVASTTQKNNDLLTFRSMKDEMEPKYFEKINEEIYQMAGEAANAMYDVMVRHAAMTKLSHFVILTRSLSPV
jgi:hypothetical protein